MEIVTMLQGYKDLIAERDKKIAESTQSIKEEYEKLMADHKKAMHHELDKQVRGFS